MLILKIFFIIYIFDYMESFFRLYDCEERNVNFMDDILMENKMKKVNKMVLF